MARTGRKSSNTKTNPKAEPYRHIDSDCPMRPEIGTQPQFRKKKPPKTYNYDSSLSPSMDWDGQNWARELGEWLLRMIEEASNLEPPHQFQHPQEFNRGQVIVHNLNDAVLKLKELSKPFLNWSGKAERLSFDVPTLPLFVHERLSTKAIVETLKSHRKDDGTDQQDLFELFGDPRHSVTDQVLGAYEHRDQWVNRLILGDSLVVMNSLLEYEGLGGQVQMIYMDPPYGIKFGSNFQPFVRKRDVKHNEDEDMTREPEMVQAYRDTWELGKHSYFTYLRDRLTLCRELLSDTGSVFVQIGDENEHLVRSILDDTFGVQNFVAIIPFRKKTMPLGTSFLEQMDDFLLWYAKNKFDANGRPIMKYRKLLTPQNVEGEFHHCWYEMPDGHRCRMSTEQLHNHSLLPAGTKVYRLKSLEPSGPMASGMFDYEFEGKIYKHPRNGYATDAAGMDRLKDANRLQPEGNRLTLVLFAADNPTLTLTTPWQDTVGADNKTYAVQTNTEIVRRCVLMSTDPGDIVLDPTCGSGTTPLVAEQWGRRWLTIDVSRVPLALARQRILTSTFPWYDLKDDGRGPSGGFIYKRKQNNKGQEVGGIVPHITLKSIAKNDPPAEEILVDKPETKSGIVRVAGPFVLEATIPTPFNWELDGQEDCGHATAEEFGSFVDRMIEVLRKSPVLRLEGNRSVTLKNVRLPAKTLSLSAEAVVSNGDEKPVAFVFGPENGAVSEKLVYEAGREAYSKGYSHLYVIGFAIQPNARKLVDAGEQAMGVPSGLPPKLRSE